jgi:hypothetical protein
MPAAVLEISMASRWIRYDLEELNDWGVFGYLGDTHAGSKTVGFCRDPRAQSDLVVVVAERVASIIQLGRVSEVMDILRNERASEWSEASNKPAQLVASTRHRESTLHDREPAAPVTSSLRAVCLKTVPLAHCEWWR